MLKVDYCKLSVPYWRVSKTSESITENWWLTIHTSCTRYFFVMRKYRCSYPVLGEVRLVYKCWRISFSKPWFSRASQRDASCVAHGHATRSVAVALGNPPGCRCKYFERYVTDAYKNYTNQTHIYGTPLGELVKTRNSQKVERLFRIFRSFFIKITLRRGYSWIFWIPSNPSILCTYLYILCAFLFYFIVLSQIWSVFGLLLLNHILGNAWKWTTFFLSVFYFFVVFFVFSTECEKVEFGRHKVDQRILDSVIDSVLKILEKLDLSISENEIVQEVAIKLLP